MKTGFAKKAARIILVVLLALIWTLEAPASEMNDQEIRDYLVAKSPFTGHWASQRGMGSGPLEVRFWMKEGKIEGALTKWEHDRKAGRIDPTGEALDLNIKNGKISFSTPPGLRFNLEVKEGKLVGTAFRDQDLKVTLEPSK